jgi:hypothetical protein
MTIPSVALLALSIAMLPVLVVILYFETHTRGDRSPQRLHSIQGGNYLAPYHGGRRGHRPRHLSVAQSRHGEMATPDHIILKSLQPHALPSLDNSGTASWRRAQAAAIVIDATPRSHFPVQN